MVGTDKYPLQLPETVILAETDEVEIRKDDLRRWMGCSGSDNIQEAIEKYEKAVRDYAAAHDLVRPAAAFRFARIQNVAKTFVQLASGDVIPGTLFSDNIPGAIFVAVAACHIHRGLEKAVYSLMKEKRYFMAIVLDAYGSAALEAVSDRLAAIVAHRIRDTRLSISSPFFFGSPGLPLDPKSCLPCPAIGMRPTKTGGFYPKKSVCMVLGVGENMPVWPKSQNCEYCPGKNNCRYRRYHSE